MFLGLPGVRGLRQEDERDGKLLRVLKVQVQAMCGVVFGLAMVSFALGEVASNNDLERDVFALPALDAHDTWHAEVNSFGDRVTSAFGVREHVADEFSGWILEAAIRHAQ